MWVIRVLVVTAAKFKTIQLGYSTVECECAAVLCRLLEAVEANEDPSTLLFLAAETLVPNSCMGL